MTRAEVAAESLVDAGYVDRSKYEELARLMAFFFEDVAREALAGEQDRREKAVREEREACRMIAKREIAMDDSGHHVAKLIEKLIRARGGAR